MRITLSIFPKNTDITKLTQEKVIEAVSWHHKKCKRTIKTYLQDYRDCVRRGVDGKEGLVSKSKSGCSERNDDYMMVITHPRNKNKVFDCIPVRIDKKVADILSWEISHTYLTQDKCSKKTIIKNVNDKCKKNEAPSDIAIYKILERIDKRLEIRLRESSKKQYIIEDTERGYTNKEAQYPLHIVAMDHTRLDLDVIDDETGMVISRPWLTVAPDYYSRCIWGFNLSFEPPSINVGLRTLLHGVFEKNARELYGTVNEWEVYGKPDIVYTDNGKDFKSAEFKRFVREVIGATIRYRPVKRPHFGGAMERFFGTLNKELIHKLPGSRKSNPEELGDVNPEEHACLTLEEVRKIIARYITDVYHMKPHRGLAKECKVPIVSYLQGIEDWPPRLVDSEDEPRFRMEMMRQYEVSYARDGISFEGIRYKSPALYELNIPGARYIIKYDDDDISKIFLLDPRLGEYVMVPAVEPPAATIAGWNRYFFKLVNDEKKRLSEEKALEVPGTQLYAEAEANIFRDVAKKSKKSRNERTKAKRAGLSLSLTTSYKQSTDFEDEEKDTAYEKALKQEKLWEEKNDNNC